MNLVFWIVTLVALLASMFAISYTLKEAFADVLSVTFSGLLLILYVLGFMRAMNLIWIISVLILIALGIKFLRFDKEKRTDCLKQLKVFYLSPFPMITFAIILFTAILTRDHVFNWWDDINFWATDTKALYFLNGFPGKYGNVAPEFGDYPPGIQIAKWCFLKLSPKYDEGLAFSGYYVMNLIFLIPLIRSFQKKKPIWQLLAFLAVYLLPGICNDIWSFGTCADVTMGIVFGTTLLAVSDYENHSPFFYYVRIGLYLSVLVLCKSIGYEWAIFAIAFLLFIYFPMRKKEDSVIGIKSTKYVLSAVGMPIIVQGAWWVLCLINRRISKLVSSGVNILTGGEFHYPGSRMEKVINYFKGMTFYPMHTEKGITLDISSTTLIILIITVIIILWRLGILNTAEFKRLLPYAIVTAVLSYGIILVSHLTVFATETQYDDPKVLAISITRYAAPFTIGMLMLITYVIIERCNTFILPVCVLVFILATTDYPAYYDMLFGYREKSEELLNVRKDMIDDDGRLFIEKAINISELTGHRILYLRDANVSHRVKDTYINYEVSPVPVVYDGFDAKNSSTDDIISKMNTFHAAYLYVDPQDGGEELFAPLLKDNRFSYSEIYRIDSEEGIPKLIPVGQ